MSKLLIIFAENGKLLSYYPQFIDDTHQQILQNPRVWFLNGQQVASPVEEKKLHEIVEPGILLVYDAHESTSYSEKKTVRIIKELSEKYKELYVCYHDRTELKWTQALKVLELKHASQPLSKKHTEEPYHSLHAFHNGKKTIDDLIVHWHSRAKDKKKNELIAMLDDSYQKKSFENLVSESALELIEGCGLNQEQYDWFCVLKDIAATNPALDVWGAKLEAFHNLMFEKSNK